MIAVFLGVTNGGMVLGVALGGFIPMAVIYFIAAAISAARVFPLLKIKMEDVYKILNKVQIAKKKITFAMYVEDANTTENIIKDLDLGMIRIL